MTVRPGHSNRAGNVLRMPGRASEDDLRAFPDAPMADVVSAYNRVKPGTSAG
ncbi:MAG TPA: hypothetical protein VND96_06605 [Candidatus Micrarchaeaceae archaeon]|nr:hypothetical protein [Candidatus Micrarchaeaceae archaeon]